jgi:Ser/Thr protein kinase RdoA (MazF antagonist)
MPINSHLYKVVEQFVEKTSKCRIEPFGAGLINDTFRIHFSEEEGSLLLQRLNHYVFHQPEGLMGNIRRIADTLNAQQYPSVILQPILTRQGKLLYKDVDGNYWRLFPFFENTMSIDRAIAPEQVYAAGRAYGEFAHALAGLDAKTAGIVETIPGFHDSVSRLAFFEETLESNTAGRLAEAEQEVAMMKANQHLFYYIASLPLPVRITHNDTKINNVLFDKQTGDVRGVIDWDTIMPGTILSDFGDMVRTMTPTYDENHTNIAEIDLIIPYFEALCQGFLPTVQDILTPIELENMVKGAQWIVLEQALRFLTDYLKGNLYYKTTYPQQNLFRTRNQLALYEALKREEEILESIVLKVLE